MKLRSKSSILDGSQCQIIGLNGIAGQGSNMKKTSKKSIFQKKKLDFSIDPGGPGSHPGGSRTDPRAEKHQKNSNFQNH